MQSQRQNTNRLTTERLHELLTYDGFTGIIRTRKTQRILKQDHDGLVVIFDSIQKRNIKLKLERIAYAMAYGKLPAEDKRVLHKNLDTTDHRIANLLLVSRKVFLQVKEAHRNLTSGIRVQLHSSQQFTYIVSWYEDGVEKSRTLQDIVPAQRLQLKLQLKYSKILTKYCVFE